MKDFFGNELDLGDKVAITYPGYKFLVNGEVVDFTAKKIRVQYRDLHGTIQETLVDRTRIVKNVKTD